MALRAPRNSELSLTDYALERLRNDIVSCSLKPGQSVSEALLAERYQLGKAPIRAALSRLSQSGMIRPINRRGYVVSPIKIKEVVEAFELRLLLEPHAAFRAAGKVPDAVIEEFDKAFDDYVVSNASSQDEFLRANRAFHMSIAAAAGFERLAVFLAELLDRTERVIRLGLTQWDGPKIMRSHHDLFVHALKTGDAAQAKKLSHDSVEFGRRMIMDALLKSGNLSEISIFPLESGSYDENIDLIYEKS